MLEMKLFFWLGADYPENVDLVALKDTTFEHNNDSDSGYFKMTS